MIDEETDNELKIKSSSFCEPYLLVIREDFSAVVLQMDASGELDEVEQGEAMSKTQWISGCVYKAVDTPKAAVYLLDMKGTLNVCKTRTSHMVMKY
jgi:cleavage and polyadenylation specificity factor subunit 1